MWSTEQKRHLQSNIVPVTIDIYIFTITLHTSLLPFPLYLQSVDTMYILIQLAILLAFLVTVVDASGDRRGSSSSTRYPSTSFSSQEQALFGNCNTEDCIFGSPAANFGPFPEDADKKRSKEPTKTVPETDKSAAGFGGPTAFIRKQ
jgi:hypothetical protein